MNLPEKLKNYNLYHLLGVETFSDIRGIKKGYRSIALKYHPDRFPVDKNSALKFDLGTDAYKLLLNEKKRSLYDDMLRGRLRRVFKFKNEELIRQRRKTMKRFYSRRGLVDLDYNRFIDECRTNFLEFLKNPVKARYRPKIYSPKTLAGEDFKGFVEEGRQNFSDFLKSVPRVRKRNL